MTGRNNAAGLQVPRTSLAWSRTALALLVNAVLLGRVGVLRHEPVVVAFALVLVVGSTVTWRASVARAHGKPGVHRSLVLVTAGLTAVASLLALGVALA